MSSLSAKLIKVEVNVRILVCGDENWDDTGHKMTQDTRPHEKRDHQKMMS